MPSIKEGIKSLVIAGALALPGCMDSPTPPNAVTAVTQEPQSDVASREYNPVNEVFKEAPKEAAKDTAEKIKQKRDSLALVAVGVGVFAVGAAAILSHAMSKPRKY